MQPSHMRRSTWTPWSPSLDSVVMKLPEHIDIDIYLAMEEYDENPREFLRKHHYGQAQKYWILARDGDNRPMLYPSRAILGVALKSTTGIRPGMTSGVSTQYASAAILKDLGYKIVSVPKSL